MAESGGKREASGALPRRWGGWVDACWEPRGGGLFFTAHPPSSSPLAPQRNLEGGREESPQRMGRTVWGVQPGFALTCLLQFCSKMLGPRWFYLQTPLTLSPQRRKHLAPRCPLNDSISVFKKVNVRGEKRKEKLRSQPVHDTVLTAGFGCFMSSFGAGFLFFSPTIRMYIFHYNDEETSYILGRKRRGKKRAEEINTAIMQLCNLGTKNTFLLNNTWLSPNSPTRKKHRHC